MSAARIYLQVPFAEKDEARRRGARWDPEQKSWYIPEGVDCCALQRWIPELFSPNIRAKRWYLARGTRRCWRCHASSCVFGIKLPAGYKVLVMEDDPADDYWKTGPLPTSLSYIAEVSERVESHLRRLTPRYRIDYSHVMQCFYWMNHCEHCAAKLGDFETFHEPDDGFGYNAPNRVHTLEIRQPFAAECGSYTEL